MIPVIINKKIYNKSNKLVGFNMIALQYDQRTYKCIKREYYIQVNDFLTYIKSGKAFPVNFTIKSNGVLVKHTYKNGRDTIEKVAKVMRHILEKNYGTGTDLSGRCIEASSYLEAILRIFGVTDIKQVEGYCLYEDEYYGSDRPYGEHTWVELGNGKYYLDITADQFNPAFFEEEHFKPIEFRYGTPEEMMTTETIEGYHYWTDITEDDENDEEDETGWSY